MLERRHPRFYNSKNWQNVVKIFKNPYFEGGTYPYEILISPASPLLCTCLCQRAQQLFGVRHAGLEVDLPASTARHCCTAGYLFVVKCDMLTWRVVCSV